MSDALKAVAIFGAVALIVLAVVESVTGAPDFVADRIGDPDAELAARVVTACALTVLALVLLGLAVGPLVKRQNMGNWIRALSAVAALLLVVAIVVGELEPDEAAVAAGLLVVAAVLIAVGPNEWRDLAKRLKSLKVGSVEASFGDAVDEAQTAVGQLPGYAESDPDAEVPDTEEGQPDDLLTLRLRLEAKLAYVAKWLLGEEDQGKTTYVTIGSLHYDNYLTDEEAHTATRVLTYRDEELETVSARDRVGFLKAADQLVTNLRASVFWAMVRKKLEQEKVDDQAVWRVEPLPRPEGGRPDLLAVGRGDPQRRYHLVPRFVMTKGSKQLKLTVSRLKKRMAENDGEKIEGRIIVVPDRSRSVPGGGTAGEDVQVVRFTELAAALNEPASP